MINNNKFIKLSLILGMLIAIIIGLVCVIYGIITVVNYFSPFIILIIIYGLFQIVPFLFCLNNYNNQNQSLFITGLISLLSFVIPGIIILLAYFQKQKKILSYTSI